MEPSPKFKFVFKKNAKMASATIVTLMAVMGVSTAQIIKDNGEQIKEVHDPAKSSESPQTLHKLSHDDLIKLLTSDEYKLRQDAHEFIWKLGKAIIPALEIATNMDDPEIATRASDILRNLRIGVTYDTPKHIADKVAEFQTALLDKQDEILRFLYQEKAYNQMVYMLAEMENRGHAGKLHKNFQELPFLAARSELMKENTQGAIELLKMSPQSDAVKRSLAFVYARSGLARKEYEKTSQILNPNDKQVEWSLTLLEEMDDRATLREFAHRNKISSTLNALDLLEGDPTSLISALKRKPTAIHAMGNSIIKDIYAGKSPRDYADIHVKLINEARRQLKLNKYKALNTLFLTGGDRLGESVLLEAAPTKAFSFLEGRERPAEALAALGLIDDASIIKWRDALIAEILNTKNKAEKKEQDVNYVNEELHIIGVAGVYSSHGAQDKARLILDPLVTALYNLEDNERWVNLIADLPSYNMHSIAMHYILDSDKDAEITQMIDVLFDGTESVKLVWSQLNQRKKTIKENFMDMGVIMGMYQGKEKLRSKLEAGLLSSSEVEGLEQLNKMRTALYQISDFRYDSISASRYLTDAMMKLKLDEETQRSLIQDLFVVTALNLDWKRLIKLFEKHSNFQNESPEWLTIRSIAERELGNKEKADALLDKAILLTVGQRDDINDVFSELVWAGDMKRATDLIERELLINASASESYPFTRAVGILANSDSHYLLSGKWGIAAAMAYTSNVISLSYLRDNMSEPSQLTEMMKMNFVLNFARGMELSEAGDHEKAKHLLKNANDSIVGDGALADIFYPAVRNTPYQEDYEQWVLKSYDHLSSAITDFPNGANTRNTMAWILSRSATKLDEGIQHSTKALELAPNEAAYLDTLAELWFAKGDRKKAIEWGEKAVLHSKSGRLISRSNQTMTKARTLNLYGQLKRFRTAPLPKK